MDLQERIKAFDELGKWINNYFSKNEGDTTYEDLETIIIKAKVKNGWFTPENSKNALQAWGKELNVKNLNNWLAPYDLKNNTPKKIGIIMAGNIPMVGFHDFITVLLSGHIAMAKLSSDDAELMPFIINKLLSIEPRFKDQVIIAEKIKEPDAVIATGSNNTARYFEAYFGKYPNIIRKNRNSVAVLTGEETDEELKLLADDLFMYFGLGCRNVTKLYLPEGFDLNRIFGNILDYSEYGNHHKYSNNYDYYRAIYLLNKEPFLENGFAVMRENKNLGSPVAIINYEFYKDLSNVQSELRTEAENIQCIVSNGIIENSVGFGESQKPGLNDYADNVDTVKFLQSL